MQAVKVYAQVRRNRTATINLNDYVLNYDEDVLSFTVTATPKYGTLVALGGG